jgi:hypothetical protein
VLFDRPNRPETLEVEHEEEVDREEKRSYILQIEVEKSFKEMRNIKFRRDDDIPGDVLKLLTKQIKTLYENREWPKGITEVTMIALKKRSQATKCSDHRTINFFFI